jgi:hypothetical protein
MHPVWKWVEEARYHGKHVIDGTTFDLWGHHFGGVDLEVAVSEHDANRPHYFTRRTPSEHRVYHLISFATFKPNATWFTVPKVCANATESLVAVGDSVDGNDAILGSCSLIADGARQVVTQSNGMTSTGLIAAALNKAGVAMNGDLAALAASGKTCTGGAQVGDIFFEGSSAAVYLGGNDFAECPTVGTCAIVPFRDFAGGCKRFC